MNNLSKEGWPMNEKFLIVSKHHLQMSHCIAISCSLIVTIGCEGELHLYRLNEDEKYQLLSIAKVFDCPVIAYDCRQSRLLLLSFDRRIAVCKVQDQNKIIITESISFRFEVLSCAWGSRENEIILASSNQNSCTISVLNRTSDIQSFQLAHSCSRLLRRREEVYLLTRISISKLYFIKDKVTEEVLLAQSHFQGNYQILDFAVSNEEVYGFIVVLTRQKVYFFYRDRLNLKPQVINLPAEMEVGRLQWGDVEGGEILVYGPYIKGKAVQGYRRFLGGWWERIEQ